ncbi:heme oxygenase (biliverdin-producing) [Promicromonospora citrea]|uniref:Biliverdin-producing heme oxygenase n=1 Tax=Promicromonospora citrea TaxID=43677 RepID=A0A8H9L7P1_9MICO|nr:biliverdin-producing heme oxygenase [Promicromonospora citrea]GGM41031.1 biliverdin-producing heme oxygenase [Promicromonospora citrea]
MSLPAEDLAPAPLSVVLREGTRAAHGEANSEQFVEELLSGALDRAAYADLSAQLLVVYEALEAASAALAGDDRATSLVFEELTRVPAIERDLAYLYGPGWRAEIRILPATRAYADHVREVGSSLPHYAAHSYTRYLGDLSGGQIVKRMMKQHYGLGEEGVAFYTFPDIPKVKVFKDAYRAALDGLGLDETEVATTLDEVHLAFRLNRAVFGELAAIHCGNAQAV